MLFYSVNRLITNDSGDPSPQRTLTTIFKPMDGGQNAHKAILHHIFCRLTIWNIPKCCSHNISRKAVVQAMHCLPVSFMYRLKKLLFCLHRLSASYFFLPVVWKVILMGVGNVLSQHSFVAWFVMTNR